ncbi:hypothetical protein [Streptomyces sp. NPDC058867]|uniref:hypothetical protein n=1 Tax=unclassified Streptomyces TaxID=2593676 RepID=UPI0036968AA2
MATVSLTGTSKEDAATVLGVLRAVFPTDRPVDDVAQQRPGDRSSVWSADFEPTAGWNAPDPAPLHGPVSATVQGSPQAVDRLFEVLSTAFAVQQWGVASGDQEKEVDLRLGTKD